MTQYEINKKYYTELNGHRHCIKILTQDKRKPPLIFIHGGPGIPNRHEVIAHHHELSQHFSLVAYDQRGTGGSYRGTDFPRLNVDTYVEDLKAVIDFALDLLQRQQAYLLGNSWGTELGTLLVQRYPSKVRAYVGTGQVVNGVLNEELSFQFAFDKAQAAGDKVSLKKLNEVGPPVNGVYKNGVRGLIIQRNILAQYGGSSIEKKSYWESIVKPVLFSKEYSFSDTVGIIRGYRKTLMSLWAQVMNYDFIENQSRFDVPVYIFQGAHDHNTPASLVKRYFEVIEAPHKELVWFEHSAHDALSVEKEKFHRLLVDHVLKNTQ